MTTLYDGQINPPDWRPERTHEQAEAAVDDLLRWAMTNPHRARRHPFAVDNDEDGDRQAWHERLSGQIAEDRDVVLGVDRSRRRLYGH